MKIKILTMAFTRPELLEKCLRSLAKSKPPGMEHYILDQHYPLPDALENRRELDILAWRYGAKIIDAGQNLGYHEGINWAINQMGLEDDDVVVNLDPDAQIAEGADGCWLTAIRNAFERDSTLACVGINNETIDRELKERGFFDEKKGSLTLRFMQRPVVMSIIAWQAGFIREVGGLKENTLHYGGVEAVMWPYLCERGRRWAVLPDFWEDVSLWYEADPEYRDWKVKHGQEHSFKGSFEDYCRAIGRIK